jgi:hydroxymethylpyrimidine pyrophosphatase-like HAD family hydrolase
LIDLLPDGVSKAYSLAWWVESRGEPCESIIYAGDSGNDYAALTAGYQSILVGNADRTLAKKVSDFHQSHGWNDRLFLATQAATSGVLEGFRHFAAASRS